MIYILFSADYELYLGGNYLPEDEVLIEPTKRLLDTCNELGIPLTLFCDVACLWRYRDLGQNEFPNAVEAQLKQSLLNGHDIQSHIHPHWNFTEINNGNYKFNMEKFLLGNLSQDADNCYKISLQYFRKAKDYLETLLKAINQDYRCIAFRAGGYGLQPQEKMILSALIDAGYLIDSSIVPGLFYESNVNRIDFRKIPTMANYYLSGVNGLESPANTGIFEIPIVAGKISFRPLFAALVNKLKYRIEKNNNKSIIKRGYNVQSKGKGNIKLIPRLRQQYMLIKIIEGIIRTLIRKRWHLLELGDDAGIMIDLTKNYLKKYEYMNNNIYISCSTHPKALGDRHFATLAKYYKELSKMYGNNLKAITFQQAAKLIGKL